MSLLLDRTFTGRQKNWAPADVMHSFLWWYLKIRFTDIQSFSPDLYDSIQQKAEIPDLGLQSYSPEFS